jgi:hypothetical protein
MSANPTNPGGDPAVLAADDARANAPGTSFEQFTAQAVLASEYDPSADEQSDVYHAAAQRVAELRGYASQPSRQSFGAQAQLQKDEWVALDENLVTVAQDNLVIVDDLRASNLVINSDLSTLIHEYQSTNEFGDAEVDMSPASGEGEDASAFSLNGVPLPIVQKGFTLDVRTQLMPSRNLGQSLDTQNQTKAARSVMEGLEDLVFNGWSSTVDGYQVYGLRGSNAEPNVNSFSGSDWDDFSGNDAGTVRGDVLTAVETLEDDNYGPGNTGYWAYFGRDAYQALRRWDTGTDQERGLLERLNEEITEITRWRRADALPNDEAVVFKPTEDVIQLAVASDVQNVEWENLGGWEMHMKVMGSMTPVIKSDEQGQSGVVNVTGLLA